LLANVPCRTVTVSPPLLTAYRPPPTPRPHLRAADPERGPVPLVSADIYSLGVVFYEMLTGELPLGRFPPPSQKAPVDVRLDPVVLRALEKEPERRYQHASEVKSEVESLSLPPAFPPAPPAVRGGAGGQVGAADRAAGDRQLGASDGRLFRWLALYAVGAVYGLSFLLPAVKLDTFGPGTYNGLHCFQNGWQLGYTSWYANPALWAGGALLALRCWRCAAVMAHAALILSLSDVPVERGTRALEGYWVWVGSTALLAGCGLYGWWRFGRAPSGARGGRSSAPEARPRPDQSRQPGRRVALCFLGGALAGGLLPVRAWTVLAHHLENTG
jgi:hypothetical protein